VLPGTESDFTATLTFETPTWDASQGVTLFTELGGTSAGVDQDQLVVTGDALLGGVLDVDLLGYAPGLGDEFEVVDVAGSLSGEFESLNLPALSSGLTWDVLYGDIDGDLDNEVLLRVIEGETPIADGDNYAVLHDNTLDTAYDGLPSVLANDFDPQGDPLTAVLDTTTSNGTLDFFDDGHFVYTPNAGFVGTDYFTYHAEDEFNNNSNIATVTIDVTNTPPEAYDDVYSVQHDTALNVDEFSGVLSNDFDDDGDPLSAVLVDDVDHGTLTLYDDGSFDYTPNAGFAGTDFFSYAADDGFDQTLALVTIDVTNTAPEAYDNSFSTVHDEPLSETVFWDAFDEEGDPLTFVVDTLPANGDLVFDSATGDFTYTPDAGFVGQDSFTWHANDGLEDSNIATVTIDVTNTAPEAYDNWHYTEVDTPLSETVFWDAFDEEGDPLTFILDTGPANGDLVFDSATGDFTYTPDAGFVGQDSFTWHANDGIADSNIATLTIDVDEWSALQAAGLEVTGSRHEPVTHAELHPIAEQAVAEWDRVLDDAAVEKAMQGVTYRITDLPGNTLGLAGGRGETVVIDIDAAGYGWFIDPTPAEHEEFDFNVTTNQFEADSGPAADRIDLLTVVLHELGHVAGLDDAARGDDGAALVPGDLMLPTLDVGTRRLPNQLHRVEFFINELEAQLAQVQAEQTESDSTTGDDEDDIVVDGQYFGADEALTAVETLQTRRDNGLFSDDLWSDPLALDELLAVL